MEQVRQAPAPELDGCRELVLDAWDFGASQRRARRICSNLKLMPVPILFAGRHDDPLPTVLATENKYSADSKDMRRAGRKLGRKMTLAEVNVAMGLPAEYSTPALTVAAAYEVRGNGVPLQLGRAIARAARVALGLELVK